MYEYEIYDFDTNEYVCANHIGDKFIAGKIRQTGQLGQCNYCGKNRIVVPLSEVLKIIVIGIEYLFEDPGNSRYFNKEGIHGYDGDTFDFYDLWQEDKLDLDVNNVALSEDIFSYLNNDSLYCYKDEFVSESDHLDSLWTQFKDTVKYKARFVFYYKNVFKGSEYVDPFYILQRVQKSIRKFDLITDLPAKTVLYRTRQHSTSNEVKKASDIASAPQYLSKAYGRMNPSGISMFYCSKNKDLTIAEVVDTSLTNKPYYTSAIFRTKKSLRLVDLTKFPAIPSIFDLNYNNDRETIFFLKEFVKDISKPIDVHDTVVEYIPTQIVTEYIKFNPKLNVQGIIYPSSKVQGKNNIVLFYNHEESLSNLTFSRNSLTTIKI